MDEIKQLRIELEKSDAALGEAKEENKRLREEIDRALAKLREAMKAFSGPDKVRRERDTAIREVAELQKFKDEAQPHIDLSHRLLPAAPRFSQLGDAIDEATNILEEACVLYSKPDSPNFEEGYNKWLGVQSALSAATGILGACGVGRRNLSH